MRTLGFIGLMSFIGLFAFPQRVLGQTLERFSVPTSMCAGSSQTVTFGYSPFRNIVISEHHNTLGHSERIFLPDGVPCGTMGCSYRSHVVFSSFAPGATITSVQDIKYVRLNMEHSWIGDIYIGITCPNGQKASLLKYSGNGSADCTDNIPSSHRGWASGNNVNLSIHLGNVQPGGNSTHPCDSSASGNEPGTGWNYCWSDNTSSGYSYAHSSAGDDGIIYRTGHAHNGKIDSSNLVTHSNFYHPDQSFSSLIGCPLNGDWYIEVMDGWGGDNGYIFEWEMSLDAQLIPQDDCVADSFLVSGYGITKLNDTLFLIQAPTHLTHDTTVYYNYHIYSSCGNDIDSTVALTFHPNYYSDTTVENCEYYTWNGHTYTTSATIATNTHSVFGCDSIETVDIIIHPGYHLQQEVSIVENDLPYSFMGLLFFDDVSDTLLTDTTSAGCDSNVNFTLHIARNKLTVVTDTVCLSATPYLWAGHQYTSSIIDTALFFTSEGADSVVILQLTVLPSHDIHLFDTVCKASGYTLADTTYHQTGTYVLTYTNQYLCDSVITLHLLTYGDNLKAQIKAIPLIVTPSNPDIRLYDYSEHNSSRTWLIEDHTYTDDHLTYTFPEDADSLPVTLVAVSNEGCTDTAITVILIDRATLFTPNVFTPSESTNNTWQPVLLDILSLEIWIYNRQGQIVAHLEGTDAYWDGTSNGTPCPQGAYVYTLLYRPKARPEKQIRTNGTILLLR